MFTELQQELASSHATLVAVSKTKPAAHIRELYDQGHRHFGENRVQELSEKYALLPKDIQWHMIGRLQTNKVRFIAPFVHMIHSVDSIRLLREINKRAAANDRTIKCLLQFKIAREESKAGFQLPEVVDFLRENSYRDLPNVQFAGVMGMATYTDNKEQVRDEFRTLNNIFLELKETFFADDPNFTERSMGMTDDFRIALEEGSTMVRIGRLLFGRRNYVRVALA